MFFKLHSEHKIGYKRLSAADLGKGTSHQTHIGLYEDILDYLPNTGVVQTAMLIYGGYCDIIDCYFDRIENPNGTFRSPKIRIGDTDSVARRIREFASKDSDSEWYLVWFGLDSQELVFMLLRSGSPDYEALHPYLQTSRQVISEDNPAFTAVLRLIEQKVDMVSVDLQEELEIVAQTGKSSKRYKPFDIEKARTLFKSIGRQGEELVCAYLDRERVARHIVSYKWMNASRESGLPFDFIVDDGLSSSCHIDVKSTNFKFAQPIVFSDGEIDFIKSRDYHDYQVYRVYDMSKTSKALKICTAFLSYAEKVHASQLQFRNELSVLDTKAPSISYAVSPLKFKLMQDIKL